MQKERATVKQDKIIIVQSLNKLKNLIYSRAIGNILSHVLNVLQILKPTPGGRN